MQSHELMFKLILVFGTLIWVGLPCFLIAVFGSKMINDMGIFPTKAAGIQVRSSWIIAVEIVYTVFTIIIYRLLV